MNRRRVLGWCLLWLSIVPFSVSVGAFFGMTVVGAGKLAGMGDEVTVVGTEEPGKGDGRSGNGYYEFDGRRVQVTVAGLEKGERKKATLAIHTGLGEPGAYAYVDDAMAWKHVVRGLILSPVAVVVGLVLYRTGRRLAPERRGKSKRSKRSEKSDE